MRLEVADVSAGYGDATVLRGVSLVVPEGRAVALLGPNGAGKTTLLSVCSGLIAPRRGKVLLDGVPTNGARPEQLVSRGLSHITEGRSVFPGLTVAENLRMFTPRSSGKEDIERAVDAFPRLGERLGQQAGTLSGGEQQMLALARAYVQRAPLVMLDEVSMGLAPILVDDIFAFLRRLKDEGHSLLVVEQYVAKALELADLVYVLVRGRIVFAGESAEVVGSDVFSRYLGSEAVAS